MDLSPLSFPPIRQLRESIQAVAPIPDPEPRLVLEFVRWRGADVVAAQVIVPTLLALRGPLLRNAFRTRPELRTPAVIQGLLTAARDPVHRSPARAHELTSTAVRYARTIQVPREFESVALTLQGEAWREHARALWEIGRPARASRAIRLARWFFEDTPGSGWHLATVDLIEAALLHDRRLHDQALRTVRNAADWFRRFGDHAREVGAGMLEAWMLRDGGNPDAAAGVLQSLTDAVRRRCDRALLARLIAKRTVFEELRHATIRDASRLLI